MAEISTQQQYDALVPRLKAGEFNDRPELERELALAARAWKAQSQAATQTAPEAGPVSRPLDGLSPQLQGAAGVVENIASAGTSLLSTIAGGLIGGAVSPFTGIDGAVRQIRGIQELGTYQPRTKAGQDISAGVGDFFGGLDTARKDLITDPVSSGEPTRPTDNPFGSRTAPTGGLGVSNPVAATALETGGEGLLMLAGARRARIPTSRMNTRQKVASLAADNDIIITPGEQAGGAASLAEGMIGRARVRQLAANKNITAYNRLANKTLGRVEDAPISIADLTEYRRSRSGAYQVIDDFGDMTIDTQFRKRVRDASADIRRASKDVPSLIDQDVSRLLAVVDDLTSANRVGRPINSQSLRGTLARIRAKTDEAFKAGNTDIANAYRDLSKNLEDVIDRNLQRSGDLNALKEFREARQDIAKSYSIQESLAGDDIINPASLASQRKRGVPLTDELELIARAHEQFPQSTSVTPVTKGNPLPISGVDALTGVAALGSGNVPLAFAPLGAMGLRNFISSPAGAALAAPIRTSAPGLAAGGLLAESPEQR